MYGIKLDLNACYGKDSFASDDEHASLLDWWNRTSSEDAHGAWAKAQEYGSKDLSIMGAALVPDDHENVGIERALRFYLLGKVSRMFSDVPPSDDTLRDVVVYAMMIRRLRATGRWP